jgi:hypothetical protein
MSQTRLRLPGEPTYQKEYPNDPGPRKWSKRATKLREARFNRPPEITARRFGLKENTGLKPHPVHGLSGKTTGR